MIEFFLEKRINGYHEEPSNFGGGKFENWNLILHLLEEIWGGARRIAMVKDFIDHALSIESEGNCIGFNGAYVEEKGEYFVISYEWESDVEFLFSKEKFKQFIDVVEKTSQEVYSHSKFESPDRLKFIIDDDWNTRIEQVYLNADTSFFETDGSGRPQFRFERIKGYQYKLVQNDCANDPIGKTLGIFVEDVWNLTTEQNQALELLREKESGRFDYKRTYFEKDGDVVRLIRKDGSENTTLTLTKDYMYRIIVLTRQFCRNLPDAPLDKLPGVIFFTFDEYWNLIPVPLFRLENKNFVDKE